MNKLSSHLSHRRFLLISLTPMPLLASVDKVCGLAISADDSLLAGLVLHSSSITKTLDLVLSIPSHPILWTMSARRPYARRNVDFRFDAGKLRSFCGVRMLELSTEFFPISFKLDFASWLCSAATSIELKSVTPRKKTSCGNGRCMSLAGGDEPDM